MTPHPAPGRDGSIPAQDIAGASRRERLGWDGRPVVVVPAVDRVSAATFPLDAILRFDVDRGRAVARRLLHAVLFLATGLVTALAVSADLYDASLTTVLPEVSWGRTATVFVALALLLVIVCVDALTVVTWEMYAVGAVLGLVFHILTGESVRDTVFVAGVLGIAAWAARRSRVARRARWSRLRQVVRDHVLVEAEVLSHGWYTTPGAGAVRSLRLVLASAQLPGQQWDAQLSPDNTQVEAAPETGDRMLVFTCPGDPEVAVVRPVLPG